MPTRISRDSFRGVALKAISVVVALVLWLVVLGSRHEEVTKEIPVAVIAPPGLVVSSEIPTSVVVRIEGPKAFLKTILARRESAVQIDLSQASPGMVPFQFSSQPIKLPLGVRVVSVSPAKLVFRVEGEVQKELDVELKTKGKIREGFQVQEFRIEPNRVLLTGPASQLEGLTKITTAPVDLSEVNVGQPVELSLPLEELPGVRLVSQRPRLLTALQVIQANFRLRNIPIEVQSSYQSRVDQTQVTVYVRAAADRMKDLRDGSVIAKLNVVDKNRGRYREKVQVLLPPGVSLVRVVPEYVRVTLY